MPKASKRLSLRVTPDNPIFFVNPNERSKKAEEWLRIGASVEKLERVANQLEKLMQNGTITNLPVQERRDKKIEEMDLRLIKDILSMGGSKK